MLKIVREWKLHKDTMLANFNFAYYSAYFIIPWPQAFRRLSLLHFLLFGSKKGLRPEAHFDPLFYASRNHDVVNSGMHVWVHYICHGRREERIGDFVYTGNGQISLSWKGKGKWQDEKDEIKILEGFFDHHHYKHQLGKAKILHFRKLLLKHYIAKGRYHDLSPVPFFNTKFYRSQLLESTDKPFIHFLQKGIQEGNFASDRRINSQQYIQEERDRIQEIEQSSNTDFKYKPLISVVMPVYNPKLNWLIEAVESVQSQLYQNWELCIGDDLSTDKEVHDYLKEIACDPKIKIVFRSKNGHISAASNSALEVVNGEFIALLDHDDIMAPHALWECVNALNKNSEIDLLYSNEDKFDDFGYYDAYFKTDWNYKLLLSQNYISHLGVYRKSIVDQIGGFRLGYEGSQDYDLLLRFIENTSPLKIKHIDRILYHWRAVEGSTAIDVGEKHYAYEAGRRAIQDHLKRIGVKAEVKPALIANFYRVNRALTRLPLVSIVIPTRNHLSDLKKAVDSVLRNTYQNFELIIVDNDSDELDCLSYLESLKQNSHVTILKYPGAFNYSAINNYAVKHSNGELILFLNNDIEAIDRSWLEEMVKEIQPDEVGIVGAKLLYPDNTVQHAGVELCTNGGVANHTFKGIERNNPGSFGKALIIQNYPAVTAACMLVKKDLFIKVRGFDEVNLKVAFNDVDLCLKIGIHLNKEVVWTPHALLYHFESKSRGDDMTEDNRERFHREIVFMKEKYLINQS